MGLIGWLVAVGCMLIGSAIGIWGLTEFNKLVAIWAIGVPGAFCIVIAGGFEIQKFALAGEKPRADSPDRPWVSIEIQIVEPLAYDGAGWDAGIRWHIPVRYKLTNTGNSPALNVDFHAAILPFMLSVYPADSIKNGVPQGKPTQLTDSAAELKRMCTGFAQLGTHFRDGRTLFRGQSVTGIFNINGDPAKFEEAKRIPGFSGNFLLLVCANYRFAGEDALHQTGDAFAIFRPNGKIDIAGETVGVGEFRITPQPMGGSFAN